MFLLSRFSRAYFAFIGFLFLVTSGHAAELLPGSISGTVTDIDTTTPLAGFNVAVYDQDARRIESVFTNALGEYVVSGLAADTDYFIQVHENGDYFQQVYGKPFPCVYWCNADEGQAILVSAGEGVVDINIAMQKGGSISGVVTAKDNNQVLSNIRVSVCEINGSMVNSSWTNENGEFRVNRLLTGDYYLNFSSNEGDYASVQYGGEPNFNYWWCGQGDLVEVLAGVETTEVDQSLAKAGIISGVVRDADTSEPLVNTEITVYNWRGQSIEWVETDESGSYQAKGLAEGYYFVGARRSLDNYASKMFGDMKCAGRSCPVTQATPIDVVKGKNTGVIDISLEKSGAISGAITGDDSAPLDGFYVQIFDVGGNYLEGTWTNSSGEYFFNGLEPGSYYLRATSYGYVYVTSVYGLDDCNYCDVTDGQAIDVEKGETATGVNFILPLKGELATAAGGGSISGTVFDAGTGEIINGQTVGQYYQSLIIEVFLGDGSWVASTFVDVDGNYQIDGLQAGRYYLKTTYSGEYIGTLYSDNLVECVDWCDVSRGIPVFVGEDEAVSEIDFRLHKGGVISGVVKAIDGKNPGYASVVAYDENGWYQASAYLEVGGQYRFEGLPRRVYFIKVDYSFGNSPYLDKVFGGEQCNGWSCDVTGGQAIFVNFGEEIPDINITVQKGGVVAGKISDAASGGPLSYMNVEIFNSAGSRVRAAIANSKGEYKILGLNTGSYYVRSSPIIGYWNKETKASHLRDYRAELYGYGGCANECDVHQGTAVTAAIGQVTDGIDFSLNKGNAVIGKLLEGEAGEGLPSVKLSIFDANGKWLGFYVWTNANGEYEITGLSEGDYFLIAHKVGRDIYDYLDCELNCVVAEGVAFKVMKGQTTTNADIVLGQNGVIQDDQNQTSAQPGSGGGGMIGWELFVLMVFWMYYGNSIRRLRYRKD